MRAILLNTIIATTAFAGVFWLTGHYDTALRDPRFFDGWALCAGMGIQLLFHLKRKIPAILFGSETMWRRVHIYAGYFVVMVFAVHTGFSVPETGLEWALWVLFIVVAISGLFGAYLVRAIPFKLEQEAGRQVFEDIPAQRSRIEQQAGALALECAGQAESPAICDLYSQRLHAFFHGPQNFFAHLRSSRRPLKRLLFEIDTVRADVDPAGQQTLNEIKTLVEKKDRLDFQYAHEGMLRAWLFVHVPATYSMIALSVLHMSLAYAFESGA